MEGHSDGKELRQRKNIPWKTVKMCDEPEKRI